MKLKRIAIGIGALALASAAWAGDGVYSSDYPSMSSQSMDTAPVIPGTESNGSEVVFIELPADQYVVVEEWYLFPSTDEPSLGG